MARYAIKLLKLQAGLLQALDRHRRGHQQTGRYTAEVIASRRWLRELTRDVRALTKRTRQP